MNTKHAPLNVLSTSSSMSHRNRGVPAYLRLHSLPAKRTVGLGVVAAQSDCARTVDSQSDRARTACGPNVCASAENNQIATHRNAIYASQHVPQTDSMQRHMP